MSSTDDSRQITLKLISKTDVTTGKEEIWLVPEEEKTEKKKSTANLKLQDQEVVEASLVLNITDDDVDPLESECQNIDLDNPPKRLVILRNQTKEQTIYLIGTNHYCKQSHRDVRQLIRTVKPAVVMVELLNY